MTDLPGRFLTAEWRWLLMLNYEVDPALLAPLVPAGTELDAWGGKTVVSMVGFRFLKTRVLGMPIPLHRDFDEVNLRFYVRRDHPDGPRRGVVFVKELVPRFAIAWVARNVYNERYQALPMRHDVEMPGGHATYEWRVGDRWNRMTASAAGDAVTPAPGDEAEFITEHYWGYAAQRDGSTKEYRVEHPQWRVWPATGAALDVSAVELYGAGFDAALSGTPSSAFIAEGSEVTVRKGVALPPAR